jgi:hypothetical protein
VSSGVTERGIIASAALFVGVLFVSAVMDPTIRILHTFESIPYIALAATARRRRSKFTYAFAFGAGAVWLWCGAWLTTFVKNGFQTLALSVSSGQVHRPDLLIAIPAALSTGGLVLFGILGYARVQRRSLLDGLVFLGWFMAIWGYYLAIFATTAPRFLQMFQPVWKLLP